MYHFQDHGGRDVGMRFDLTVPLARFVAQHYAELAMPFKRYHIAKVWRGENTHRGRYREFMQCDFDTIGTNAVASDIEMLLVIHDLMRAIGIEEFTMRVNHRQVLHGLLERLDLLPQAPAVLRSLDKLGKIGRDKVAAELVDANVATSSQAEQILRISELEGETSQLLEAASEFVAGSQRGEAGVNRLREIVAGAQAGGVPSARLCIDVSIARGLDYYTGTIVETFLDRLPGIGSICSGGRYDNLAGVYTKQPLPGVGASLGLDRLLAALEELSLITTSATPAPVMIAFFDPHRLHDYLKLARQIRAAGIGVELYPEAKKLGQQLKFADRRGFRVALIAGDQEFERNACQVKDLTTGSRIEASLEHEASEIIAELRKVLDP